MKITDAQIMALSYARDVIDLEAHTHITDVIGESKVIYDFILENGTDEDNFETSRYCLDFAYAFLQQQQLHGYIDTFTLSDIVNKAKTVLLKIKEM
jgi:hypothetical protein